MWAIVVTDLGASWRFVSNVVLYGGFTRSRRTRWDGEGGTKGGLGMSRAPDPGEADRRLSSVRSACL